MIRKELAEAYSALKAARLPPGADSEDLSEID